MLSTNSELVVGGEPDEIGDRVRRLAHARRAPEPFGMRIGELAEQEPRRLALDLVLQCPLVFEHRARRGADGAVVEVGDRRVEQPPVAQRGAEGRQVASRDDRERKRIPTEPVIFSYGCHRPHPHHPPPAVRRQQARRGRGGHAVEVIARLDAAHAGFPDRLLDEDGGLRKFVNMFVADDDVRYLEGLDTKVADGVTVSIIPAVAGG